MAIFFTDGCSKNNGKKDCMCGIGVYSLHENLQLSMSLEDCKSRWSWIPRNIKASNNVAELLAIYIAIVLSESKELMIYSDSAYSINCVTSWYKKWEKNDWKTSNNENVKNKEIIKEIIKEIKNKDSVFFMHVNSHTQEPQDKDSEEHFIWSGNDKADNLASARVSK